MVQAENADIDPVHESLVYYTALAKAGVPAEMHLYAQGGHAFGLRRTQFPITDWPRLVETWLRHDWNDFRVALHANVSLRGLLFDTL